MEAIIQIRLARGMETYLGIILSGSLCVGMATGNFCNCLACSNRPLRLCEYNCEAFPGIKKKQQQIKQKK